MDIIQKLGGRKFILTLVVIVALIIISVVAPAALTNELIIGLLGAIATFSGSNAVLTAIEMKNTKAPDVVMQQIQPVSEALDKENIEDPPITFDTVTFLHTRIDDLNNRLVGIENSLKGIVEVVKQHNDIITKAKK